MQEKEKSAGTGQKKKWFQGLQSEFKKIVWVDRPTLVKQTIAVVAKPEAIATEHGEENKVQKRIVQPLVCTSKATIHHGCQGHRVIALVVRHCRISKRIITSVATDYFLYIVHNYKCIKSVGEYPPIPQRL